MKKILSTVLVIEDENLLLQAISKKLTLSGLQPVSCTGGEQALDYLQNFPTLPDVIWLDYHLTGMDGLTFLEKLKANPLWKSIPVVVVSNSASPDKVHHMLALGANEYLLKAEYRLDEIIDTVKKFVAHQKI
jgi:two-component system, chemotaxis family, chemotaxis protein CheY